MEFKTVEYVTNGSTLSNVLVRHKSDQYTVDAGKTSAIWTANINAALPYERNFYHQTLVMVNELGFTVLLTNI